MISRKKRVRLNLKAKLGSFIIALFLWLYVVLNNTYNYNIKIPIEIVNIKPGKILAKDIPGKMTVNFQGKGSYLLAMKFLSSSSPRFRMDLSTISSFWVCPVENYIKWIILPRGLRKEILVRDILSPDTIKVVLDDKVSKKVPIDYSKIEIKPKTGYILAGKVKLVPDSVLVTGPKKLLKNIKTVSTKLYKLENKTNDFSGEVELEPLPSKLLSLNILKTQFFVSIQRLGEKQINDVKVKIKNIPKNIDIVVEPSTVNVKVIGGVEFIKNLTSSDIEAFINYGSHIKISSNSLIKVNFHLPEEIISYESTPSEVKLSIR
ncbi:hypothetical protein DRQ09_02820 [candidate division KSB1 bacterium]|nr:MAG: hypothetical protein DRQ09_02820 [candidate division KSB1 bacterium]